MATAVSICSNALVELGDSSISSLDEENPRARLASSLYEQVRDATIRAHPWASCKKRVVLAPDSETPAFSWGYQFQLPDDWLRVLQVGEERIPEPYTVEGRKILANTNVLNLIYIFKNTVEATWDSLLVDAMEKHMKARMCYPRTKSTSAAQLAMQDYENYLKRCRAVNGQDSPPQTLGDFPLLQSRYSGQNWRT